MRQIGEQAGGLKHRVGAGRSHQVAHPPRAAGLCREGSCQTEHRLGHARTSAGGTERFAVDPDRPLPGLGAHRDIGADVVQASRAAAVHGDQEFIRQRSKVARAGQRGLQRIGDFGGLRMHRAVSAGERGDEEVMPGLIRSSPGAGGNDVARE